MNLREIKLLDKARKTIRKNKLNLVALLFITSFVLLGNIIYVSGFRDPNPLLQLSGLAVEASPRILEGTDTIDPNNGFTSQTLGNRAADSLLSANMPYWNHYEGVGAPLAGGMQSAALSPLTLLLRLPGGLLYVHIILEIIAGFFTYLVLRRLGLRWRFAIIGGMIFALNGTFAWLTNAVFNPIAFLPMAIYGVEVAFAAARSGSRRGWLWIALAIAFSLYAGFPETAFINALLVGVWALARIITTRPKHRIKYILKLFIGAFVGIALAAPILVSFAGYLAYANIGGHGDAFAHASLGRLSIPAHVMPYIYGPISTFSGYDSSGALGAHWGSVGGYVSVAVFILAIFGLFTNIDKKLKIALIVWVIACLTKMFGFGFSEFLWNLVPTIKNAAFFRYAVPSIYFAFTILAAFGLQGMVTRKIRRPGYVGASIISSLFLISATYIAYKEIWRIISAPHYKYYVVASVVWAFAVLLSIVIGGIIIRRRYLYIVFITIVLVDLLAMFIVPQLSTPKVKIDESPVEFLRQNIGTSRFYTLGPIAPNYGSYYEIASINQNNLPVPKLWSEYLNTKLDTNTDPILFIGYFRRDPTGPSAFSEFVRNQDNFRYVGVKYLVTTHNQLSPSEAEQANISRVFESKGVDIYEIKNYGNYFLTNEGCNVLSSTSRDELIVKCNQDNGQLVRKELWMPGWGAQVNGKNSEIFIDGELFQKINLQQGENSIKFNYTPQYIYLGYILFTGGLLAIALSYIPTKNVNKMIRSKNILRKTK